MVGNLFDCKSLKIALFDLFYVFFVENLSVIKIGNYVKFLERLSDKF